MIASILGSVSSPAYSFRFYHQPKTHGERRVQRRNPEGDIQSYYDSAVRHTFRVDRLCEKSFSRNAEQVCSPLILLLLGRCSGIRMCIIDIGEQYTAYVRV